MTDNNEKNKSPVNYAAEFQYTVKNFGYFPYTGDGDDEAAKEEFRRLLDDNLAPGSYEITIFKRAEDEYQLPLNELEEKLRDEIGEVPPVSLEVTDKNKLN